MIAFGLPKNYLVIKFEIFSKKFQKYVDKTRKKSIIQLLFFAETFGRRQPEAEKTLENPDIAGAEGARVKPNLSGKRTECTIFFCVIMSLVIQSFCDKQKLFIFYLGGFSYAGIS